MLFGKSGVCDVVIMFYFPSLYHAAYIVHYLVSKTSDKETPDFAHDLIILDVVSLILLLFAEWNDNFSSFFFLQIMELTDTQITWPSKLKIGAKSKKGKTSFPHYFEESIHR